MAQTVKNLPAMQKTCLWPLGWEDPPEREWLTHCNILAWRFPWTEESGGLWSTGSQRVGHDWVTKHSTVRVQSADWYILPSQQISKKVTPSLQVKHWRLRGLGPDFLVGGRAGLESRSSDIMSNLILQLLENQKLEIGRTSLWSGG